MNQPVTSASKEAAIEAVMRDPATYELAKLIPTSNHGGRPRLYPNWIFILYNALTARFQSAARVETELGHPRTWEFVRELARELMPVDEQLTEKPVCRHHFKHIKTHYLAREDIVAAFRRVHRQFACKLARDAGNFSTAGPAFTIHPSLANTTAADGKVVSTRSKAKPGDRRKDRRSGKRLPARVDPDKAMYYEGDGTTAFGLKFLPVHTRTKFGWDVLDIPFVRDVSNKAEADVAVETLRLLRPLLPGPHFHVHDGAMTSVHIQTLLTELATLPVNRPRAKENPKKKGRSIGRRVPDESIVEVKPIKCPDGTSEQLEIWQSDGNLGLRQLKENGEWHFLPLEATKLHVNRNGDGTASQYRLYVGLKLPAEVALRTGKREVTVALYQTQNDKTRAYPRTAHVRAVGSASPDFWIYTKMRNDSESLNRVIEDSLYRHHRARSIGWARQQVDMLGLAGLINALTRERLRTASLPQAA